MSPPPSLPKTREDDEETLIRPKLSSAASVGLKKKKALLIGIQDRKKARASDRQPYKGPHADVEKLRELLLDRYGYKEDDITVIIDDGKAEHVQPTRDNLIQCMKDLVAGASKGDHFYLHFSGHGTQIPDVNGDEEDGFDECIITCDSKIIIDDDLNKILVEGLPAGSTFVSTFDSCHSGTALDLTHYRCNRVYVPWVNKEVPREVHVAPSKVKFCNGRCREEFKGDVARNSKADVVSISATKDYQLSWENAEGSSMTEALIKVLSKPCPKKGDSHPSLEVVMKFISHELHVFYLDLHKTSRDYIEEENKANEKRILEGKPLLKRVVETDNFQHPQISSHFPLDMTRPWPLSSNA